MRERARLRIAVDMDEVIADCFRQASEPVQPAGRRGPDAGDGQQDGAGRTASRRKPRPASTPSPMRLDFSLTSKSLPAARKRCWNCRAIMTSTSPAPPWKFLHRSRTSSSGWKSISLSFRPAALCFAETKNIVNADVLIDDRSRHFKGFRGTGILFTAPHNAREAADLRANNWNDVLRILQGGQPEAAGAEQRSRKLSMNPAG